MKYTTRISLILFLSFLLTVMIVISVYANPDSQIREYYNTGDGFSINFYGSTWVGQTFYVELNHSVTMIRIKTFKFGNPQNLNLSIRATSDGLPIGNDLTSGIIDADTFTTDTNGAWYNITVTPYNLTMNTQYAIVVRATSGDNWNYVGWRYNIVGEYSGGGQVESSDSGSNWSIVGGSGDYMFEVWGERIPEWNYVESWNGILHTIGWYLAEAWNGIVAGIGFYFVELWSGTFPFSYMYFIRMVFAIVGLGGMASSPTLIVWSVKKRNIYLALTALSVILVSFIFLVVFASTVNVEV